MKPVQVLILTVTSLLLLTACATPELTRHTKGEEIRVEVMNDPDYLGLDVLVQQEPAPGLAGRGAALLLPMVTQTFTYAFGSVKSLLTEDLSKYTATYGGGQSQLSFYRDVSLRSMTDPDGIQFRGLKVVRTVEARDGKRDTAFFASFSIDRDQPLEIMNNGRFRLRLDSMFIRYSRAKIKSRQLLKPLSWGYYRRPKFGLDLSVSIQASWMNEQSTLFDQVKLGSFSLRLDDIPMDPSTKNYRDYFEKLKDSLLPGSCFLVPRSVAHLKTGPEIYKPCYGKGMYELTVNITENGAVSRKKKIPFDYDPYVDQLESHLLEKLLNRMNIR
ncbi:MAG TPA: hypothetical protein P5531_12665 [Bacteroidales bacterium]|nr:hypothetical protein [Bacteroidales bacterium]HSA43663.1 hypothetical protein [Bacteroidales bacterium]